MIPTAANEVRSQLVSRLGRLPERVPPSAPRVERRFVCDGIVHERWRWPGPREEIPAWFLVREDAPRPAPGLVAIHPHGRQFEVAKSMVVGLVGDPSRAYGLAAARAGFAVLAPDLPGFEDRRPPLEMRKRSYALQGESYERLLAMQALVRGETLQGWMLSDLASCADVLGLEARCDVSRLAVLGQSLGGQEAVLAMLFDPRFRAGVASCGFSLVRLLVERNISHNLALYLPGMLPDLDFDTIVPGLAPRPLYVIAGRRDPIYPVEGVEAVEARARAAYRAVGAEERLRFHYFDGGHTLPPEALAAALAWLHEVLE